MEWSIIKIMICFAAMVLSWRRKRQAKRAIEKATAAVRVAEAAKSGADSILAFSESLRLSCKELRDAIELARLREKKRNQEDRL